MATAQYLTELAVALTERGHQVTVVTGRRAYDHPDQLFPAKETWKGIHIYRVGSTRFGKTAKWRRALDFASFITLCALRLALLRRHDAVVALTSPPLISFIGALFTRLRGGRFYYWVMDMNPDEALAAGWLRSGSFAARRLEKLSRFSFRRATKIIALDRFMKQRIIDKGIAPDKIEVIPPWSHDDSVRFDPVGRDQFRKAHGLENKFVVMYSGNHSPCHPLDTGLEAARRLAKTDPEIVFCFVGGGSEWRKIAQSAERKAPSDLPPRSERYSSAASSAQRSRSDPDPNGQDSVEPKPPPTSDVNPPPTDNRSLITDNSSSSSLPSDLRPPASVNSPRTPGSSAPKPDQLAISNQQSPVSNQSAQPQHPASSHLSTLNPQVSTNLKCLPYQPLNQLSASLSAADLHLVVMGNPFVGIIHPCKIYNILNVLAPVLYIGPRPSHVTEVLDALDAKLHARAEHGDVDAVVRLIRQMKATSLERRQIHFKRATEQFSKEKLLLRLIHLLETQ